MTSAQFLGNIQPEGFPGLPEGWVSEAETFPSADQQLQLFMAVHHPREWKSHPFAHRVLLIIHGLGEHGGRYTHAPHYLKDTVGAVYCIDQRGHGRSEGIRGHCDRFTQFTDDLMMVISRVHEQTTQRFGKAEVFVLGHSFGGLVSLRTHFLNPTLPVKALNISSPLLAIRVKIPLIKRIAGKALSEIWGSLQVGNEVDPDILSHDPAVAVAYRKDRLVHGKCTPRMYCEMTAAFEDTAKRDAGLAYPLQMQLCLQDQLVDTDVAQKFFRDLKIRDKLLKTYPDFFHEPFSEIAKDKAFEDVAAWIKSHSSA